MISLRSLLLAAACSLLAAAALGATQGAPIPTGVILVKGAWSSAVGFTSPLPEGGAVSDNKYDNAYFGFAYMLSLEWTQRYEGPPPSDGGYYVLAQLEPQDASLQAKLGHVLIAAQDLFFTSTGARSAVAFINYYQDHLGDGYRIERAPRKRRLAEHDFVQLDYMSPAAGLHWHVLATEIRCHVVQFVFTGSDPRFLDGLVASINVTKPPSDGAPVCIKDFANSDTILEKEDPICAEQRFNQVPARIVIDKDGKVKQIHFLSAFPEQAKNVADALAQWRFKPYVLNGQPVEVETGILFGRTSRTAASTLR